VLHLRQNLRSCGSFFFRYSSSPRFLSLSHIFGSSIRCCLRRLGLRRCCLRRFGLHRYRLRRFGLRRRRRWSQLRADAAVYVVFFARDSAAASSGDSIASSGSRLRILTRALAAGLARLRRCFARDPLHRVVAAAVSIGGVGCRSICFVLGLAHLAELGLFLRSAAAHLARLGSARPFRLAQLACV
jgi:hypothetical protein